jgi:hypothetical protein
VDLEKRFMSKTKYNESIRPGMATQCLEWPGYKVKGYGQFSVLGKSAIAHRFAWALSNGFIPPGMEICHRCDNPACVRVDHLFVGTHADNMKDMANKGRSHVPTSFPNVPPENRPRGDKNGARLHPRGL